LLLPISASLLSLHCTLPPPLLLFSLFSLLIRPPPRSTLFPYTTLFRSLRSSSRCRRFAFFLPRRNHFRTRCRGRFGFRCDRFLLDRKSTRLNSSHGSISYAVFCLKKKKKKTKSITTSTYHITHTVSSIP